MRRYRVRAAHQGLIPAQRLGSRHKDSDFNRAARAYPVFTAILHGWRAIRMGTMRLPLLILHILAGSIALLTGTVAMGAQRRQASPRVRQHLHHCHADPGHQRLLPSHPEISGGQYRRQRWHLLPNRHGLACRPPGKAHVLLTGVRFSSVSRAPLRLSPWAFTPSTTPGASIKLLPQPA
jgi:hypothetical protein